MSRDCIVVPHQTADTKLIVEAVERASAPLCTYLDRYGKVAPLPPNCTLRRIYNVSGASYQLSLFNNSRGSYPYIEVRDLDRPESSLIVRLLADAEERDAGLVKYHRLSGHPSCVRQCVEFLSSEFRRFTIVK